MRFSLLILSLSTIQVTWSLSSFRKLRLSRSTNSFVEELRRDSSSSSCTDAISLMEIARGGSTDVDDDEDDDDEEEEEDIEKEEESEDDEEEDNNEEEDSDEEEDEEEEEEEETDDEEESDEEDAVKSDVEINDDKEYDDMITPNPSTQIFTILGVMFATKRLDMTDSKIVRIIRFAFIVYVIGLQAFLFYARIQVKARNDRTPIKITNPMSKLLEGATKNQAGQVKNIASSLLSSQSTCLEYDLKQIKSMNSGLLVNMGMLWLLHFKMNQVQPIILQTVQGLQNLYYSPLFQVYALGRNLKRPFENPNAISSMMDMAAGAVEKNTSISNDGAEDEEQIVSSSDDEEDSEGEEEEEESEEEEETEVEKEDSDEDGSDDDDDTEATADDSDEEEDDDEED